MGTKRRQDNVQNGVKSINNQVNHTTQHAKKKQKKKLVTTEIKSTHSLSTSTPKLQPNSNWLAMKSKITSQYSKHASNHNITTEKKQDLDVQVQRKRNKAQLQLLKRESKIAEWINTDSIVAIDCEMVGVGIAGKRSVLARCSIVNFHGEVLYDQHVRPVEKVTDFRTKVSGIRSKSLRHAISFAQCLKEVGKLIKDKIIVGHGLKNDFEALMFTPPPSLVRDTSRYRPYMRRKSNGTKLYPKSLKQLAEEELDRIIQTGEHDSIEDARVALDLYKRQQYAWEKYLQTSKPAHVGSLVGVAIAIKGEKSMNQKQNDEGMKLNAIEQEGERTTEQSRIDYAVESLYTNLGEFAE